MVIAAAVKALNATAAMAMFEGLIGQRAVKEKLSGLIWRGSPGHAHLFVGAAGIGKRAFARAFAKALLCVGAGNIPDEAASDANAAGSENRGRSIRPDPRKNLATPCGECAPCKLAAADALGDFIVVEPAGQNQKNVIPVDSIRRIGEWFSTKPLHSRRKVCIIENADHMTEQAQNALLKTLEEPPDYGVIIMTAANAGMLLETVRSRCASTGFTEYADSELVDILENSPDCPRDTNITLLAQLSGGNPGGALDLASSGTFFSLRDELLRLFCGHLDGDARSSFFITSFLEKNRERFSQYSSIMIHWLRDIWLISMQGAYDGDNCGIKTVNGDMADKLETYRARYNPAALLDCIERIDETRTALSANANFTLAVNAMLFKIRALLNATS